MGVELNPLRGLIQNAALQILSILKIRVRDAFVSVSLPPAEKSCLESPARRPAAARGLT